MKTHRLFIIISIAWIIICTVLLTLPGSAFPKEDWLSKIWFDKWVHIGLFALLCFFVCRGAVPKGNPNHTYIFILCTVACIGYGIAMEYVQKNWVPNRSFDTGDIIADAVGAIIGLLYVSRTYTKK